MIALVRDGVDGKGVWADLGAGTGNFTRALAALLGPHSTIYALDRDAKAIARQREYATANDPRIQPIQADFTKPLGLPPLDGILMANALHFIREQEAVLRQLLGALKPNGRLLLVEYELTQPQAWVPYPVPFARFRALAQQLGLSEAQRIGTRRSPSSGISMYAAVANRNPQAAEQSA